MHMGLTLSGVFKRFCIEIEISNHKIKKIFILFYYIWSVNWSCLSFFEAANLFQLATLATSRCSADLRPSLNLGGGGGGRPRVFQIVSRGFLVLKFFLFLFVGGLSPPSCPPLCPWVGAFVIAFLNCWGGGGADGELYFRFCPRVFCVCKFLLWFIRINQFRTTRTYV